MRARIRRRATAPPTPVPRRGRFLPRPFTPRPATRRRDPFAPRPRSLAAPTRGFGPQPPRRQDPSSKTRRALDGATKRPDVLAWNGFVDRRMPAPATPDRERPESPEGETRKLVASHLGLEKAPAQISSAFSLAKTWLDRSIANVDKLGPTASKFFNQADLGYLKTDLGKIRGQWNTTTSAGECQPDEGEGPFRIADAKGYRFLDLESGNVLADCRGPGRQSDSLITFYPRGIGQGLPALAHTVIHELSHASSLSTDDVAYGHQSGFAALPDVRGLARKNADSYSYLAAYIGTHAPALDGGGDASSEEDEHAVTAFSEPERRFLDDSVALAERIARDSRDGFEAAIDDLEAAVARGAWGAGGDAYRKLAGAFPGRLPSPDGDRGFPGREAEAALEMLAEARAFFEDQILGGAVDPEELEKDPDGDYVLRPAKGKVGLRFFRDPEPETWMLELGREASGAAQDPKLFLAVARFLAGAENEAIAPLAPGA